MTGLSLRSVRGPGLLVGGAVALLVSERFFAAGWRNPEFFSGWLLVVCLVLLGVYGARKKMRVVPAGPGSAWLTVHVYLGVLAIILFGVHAGFGLPDGRFDGALWSMVVLLFASGLFGLVVSRHIPPQLGYVRERVIFERVPAIRRQLAREVEALSLESVARTDSQVVADVYASVLEPFFNRGDFLVHLLHLRGPQRRRLRALEQARRYLDAAGRGVVDEIEERVAAKNELDYQYAMQCVLKAWLFVHVPLAYAVMPLVLLHVVLGYAFRAAGS